MYCPILVKAWIGTKILTINIFMFQILDGQNEFAKK